MRILTADEMRATDRRTVEQFSMASLALMENAGGAVARFILREYGECRRITVICGRGNNGGDGFVVARCLHEAGCAVSVLLLGDATAVTGDAGVMLERMKLVPALAPVVVRDAAELRSPAVRKLFERAEAFVDAVLGTGFNPPMREPSGEVGRMLAEFDVPVVAVDLPSGWDADSRQLESVEAFRADAVVTFTAPKLAHLFGNLTRGPIVVADIGSPDAAVESATGLTWAGSSKAITEKQRPVDSNKGKFGHLLMIGGSRGKAGAVAMTSLAALRTGAGLVTAAVPGSILPTVARFIPELMTVPLDEGKLGEICCRNLEAGILQPLLERKSIIAIGPGMGQDPEAAAFVIGLLQETKLPMVIDADALNVLANGRTHLLNGRDRTLVLTPHPGEMARLAGLSIPQVQERREEVAREFAVRHSVTLVLKGWRTLIAHPDGTIAVNTSGNPGMAKGGSGDVLTGIVAAMLAQYPENVADAVNASVYIHGLAADFALRQQEEHTLLASDTIAHLSRAFRFRSEDRDGYVWLQGFAAGIVGDVNGGDGGRKGLPVRVGKQRGDHTSGP